MTEYTGRVAAVAVENDGEYLIAFDSSDECWEFPGGKEEVERDDSIVDTGKEEIREEFGYAKSNLEYVRTGDSFPSQRGSEYEIVPLLMKAPHRDISIASDEHDNYRWEKADQIPYEDGPGMREVAENLDLI